MRVTDDRYAGELAKFDLAIRMIGHEARTGTIRACTGFTEDRIRKIYSTYFKLRPGITVRRKRGKSPTQITGFVSSSRRQSEATLIACLLLYTGAIDLAARGPVKSVGVSSVSLGQRICDAFEVYRALQPEPLFSFERVWGLYRALAVAQELYFARCGICEGPYVQDAYALDYQRCPFCELKDRPAQV